MYDHSELLLLLLLIIIIITEKLHEKTVKYILQV